MILKSLSNIVKKEKPKKEKKNKTKDDKKKNNPAMGGR